MGKFAAEAIRVILRLTHKVVPKLTKYFKFMDLHLFIPYEIFNPVYTLSTALILKHIKPYGRVLDLGCGSGVIAIYVARNFRVREVIAYDVSRKALATSRINARLNNVEDRIVFVSSRDELLRFTGLDYVVTNPPYLKLEPRDELDLNWCGGRDLGLMKEIFRLGCGLLKYGGRLVATASSATGVGYVLSYLRCLGMKPCIVALARTPLDTIYLVHAVKVLRSLT
ncbi:MAG: class I SAM-dependent methyltransferase [Desulfurococcales archaeon]|nr:class I SAM-dependent methyltransferase [Desulfurococcales archaeon]